MRLYHNPRCSKSRQALALLREAGHDPEVVEYLKTPLSAEELDEVLRRLGVEPRELMRKGEAVYKELEIASRERSRGELINLMVQNPILIERPLLVAGDRAVVGRPPERVLEIL